MHAWGGGGGVEGLKEAAVSTRSIRESLPPALLGGSHQTLIRRLQIVFIAAW